MIVRHNRLQAEADIAADMAELTAIANELVHLSVLIANRYGVTRMRKVTRRIDVAVCRIREARSFLEDDGGATA